MKSLFMLTAGILLFNNVSYSLSPSHEYKIKPEKYGMVYKEEKITTKDGAALNRMVFRNSEENYELGNNQWQRRW
jgi:hypothetical protein